MKFSWFYVALAILFVAAVTIFFMWVVGMTDATNDPNNSIKVRTVELGNGREVTCITYNAVQKGGITCDWEGAR